MSNRLLAYPRQAIGNRPPIWPLRLDARSPQVVGLIGAWPLFCGPGTGLRNLAGKVGNYTLEGGAGAPTWIATELGGWALDFDGSDDRANGGAAFDVSLPLTFVCWFSAASGYTGDYRTIWAKRDGPGAANRRIHFYLDIGSGLLSYTTGSSSGSSTFVPTADVWWHITVTISSAGAASLYVDGVFHSAFSGTVSLGSDAAAAVSIGRTGDGQDPFLGSIGEHRFYNRGLSAAEVWALYDPQTRWALYDELRVPRIWPAVATGGATTQTLTGSLDAAARKQILLAASLNAGVAAEFGGTVSVDAALQAARAAQAALDSALERALTADIAADGVIQVIRTLSISAESAVAKAIATAASLDASVTGAGVGLRGAALDAAVERLLALAASLNAAVVRLHALQAGLDAGLAVPGVRSAALEGAIERLDTLAGLALEAAVRHSADLSAVLDAVVGTVVAPGATRTFHIPARGGHAVAGDLRTLVIPGGNRRH